jgi:hypothetical protein
MLLRGGNLLVRTNAFFTTGPDSYRDAAAHEVLFVLRVHTCASQRRTSGRRHCEEFRGFLPDSVAIFLLESG